MNAEEIRKRQAQFQKELLARIEKIAPGTVVELSVGDIGKDDFFSDWHDRFNDNGKFTDAFGKAGGVEAIRARVVKR